MNFNYYIAGLKVMALGIFSVLGMSCSNSNIGVPQEPEKPSRLATDLNTGMKRSEVPNTLKTSNLVRSASHTGVVCDTFDYITFNGIRFIHVWYEADRVSRFEDRKSNFCGSSALPLTDQASGIDLLVRGMPRETVIQTLGPDRFMFEDIARLVTCDNFVYTTSSGLRYLHVFYDAAENVTVFEDEQTGYCVLG